MQPINKSDFRNFTSILQVTLKVADSPVWKGVLRARNHIISGLSFKLGDGETSFWYEDWIGTGNTASSVPFVYIHDVEIKLKDLIANGNWNVECLYTNLPTPILQQ